MPLNSRCRGFFKENLLTILTIVVVFGGTCIGLITKEFTSGWTQRDIMYIQYPGELFLRMLKCLIVPLLVSSITSAIGSLDLSMSGKIATRAIVYYLTTTISAVILGIILVTTIRPGDVSISATADAVKSVSNTTKPLTRQVLTADTLLDLISASHRSLYDLTLYIHEILFYALFAKLACNNLNRMGVVLCDIPQDFPWEYTWCLSIVLQPIFKGRHRVLVAMFGIGSLICGLVYLLAITYMNIDDAPIFIWKEIPVVMVVGPIMVIIILFHCFNLYLHWDLYQ